MDEAVQHIKALGQKDMVLFTVSAILLLDTLAASASVGSSSIFWWLFLGIVFFIPFASICAEMGCAYPELSLLMQVVIAIALTWLFVYVNIITLDVGKWVPNIGAIFKVIVFIGIIIGAIFYTLKHGMTNELIMASITPTLDSSSLQYLPAMIYCMLGFAVPGNLLVARIMAYTCFTILLLSIALFIYTPGEGFQMPVLIGAVTMIVFGEVTIQFSENHKNQNQVGHNNYVE